MLRCKGQTLAFCLFSSFFSELCVTIPRDFGSLGRGAWEKLVGFTKVEGKVLHPGNPKGNGWMDQNQPWGEGIEDFEGLKAQQ